MSSLLRDAQHAAAAASSEEVPAATYRATRDAQVVVQLSQTASRQMPLFLGTQIPVVPTAGSRQAWQAAWVRYIDAQRHMGTSRSAR